MDHCIVCLEENPENMKRLCTICRETSVCKDCRKNIIQSGHHEMLSNCPICRSPTNFNFKPELIPTYQILTMLIWSLTGWVKTIWKSSSVLYVSYSVLRILTMKTDVMAESHPSEITRKWNILNFVIHIPYFMFETFMRFKGYNSTDDHTLDSYLLYQVVSPPLFVSTVWVLRKIRGMFTQN